MNNEDFIYIYKKKGNRVVLFNSFYKNITIEFYYYMKENISDGTHDKLEVLDKFDFNELQSIAYFICKSNTLIKYRNKLVDILNDSIDKWFETGNLLDLSEFVKDKAKIVIVENNENGELIQNKISLKTDEIMLYIDGFKYIYEKERVYFENGAYAQSIGFIKSKLDFWIKGVTEDTIDNVLLKIYTQNLINGFVKHYNISNITDLIIKDKLFGYKGNFIRTKRKPFENIVIEKGKPSRIFYCIIKVKNYSKDKSLLEIDNTKLSALQSEYAKYILLNKQVDLILYANKDLWVIDWKFSELG